MSDKKRTPFTMSRRNFVEASIGSLIALPAVGSFGLFSMERVAHAADIQETGGSISNAEFAKITVVKRDEVGIVVIDMSKTGKASVDEDMVRNEEAFVVGAEVALWSRYRDEGVTGVTDKEGKVIFNIRKLSENLDNQPLDRLDEYGFNGKITVKREGYRTFETSLFRIHGTDVIVAPTRIFFEGDPDPYPHRASYNQWDCLYYGNDFNLSTGNTNEQTLSIEGRDFKNVESTVALCEQGSHKEIVKTTATPKDGVLTASFKKRFGLMGDKDALKEGMAYEIVITQGKTANVWPLQLQMKKGVTNEDQQFKLDFSPINLTNKSGEQAKIGGTVPDWFPVFGGMDMGTFTNVFRTGLSGYLDPSGYMQLTFSKILGGYHNDNGEETKPEDKGWREYPIIEYQKAINKYEEKMTKLMKNGWKDMKACKPQMKKFFASIDVKFYVQAFIFLKWSDKNGDVNIWRGGGGAQLNIILDFVARQPFYAGPIPGFIELSIGLNAIFAYMFEMHTGEINPSNNLAKQLIDFKNYRITPGGTGVSFNLTLTPALSIGVGIRGFLSVSARGKFVFSLSISRPFDDDNPIYNNKPMPHAVGTGKATVEAVFEAMFYTKTWVLWNIMEKTFFDNWKKSSDIQAQLDQSDPKRLLSQSSEMNTAEFFSGMDIVTSKMLNKTIESTALTNQSLTTQESRILAVVKDFSWKDVLRNAIERFVQAVKEAKKIQYHVYRFERPKGKMSTQSDAKGKKNARISPSASRWHKSSNVYEDVSVVATMADQDGFIPQSDSGSFLPAPAVEDVKNTGGVRPSSDVIISTNDDGTPRYIYGAPRIKVLDIRTSTSSTQDLRATCSFRIGTVSVNGTPRSRLIMTVLDAGDELKALVGTQRVIDFDITDLSDVSHDDMYDYEFSIAFSSYSESAGGVESSIDQVEIVIVSGIRQNDDSTPIASAATEMYLTYLNFDAPSLFRDDFASVEYMQVTLPGNRVLNPKGEGDDKYHYISSIKCVSAPDDQGSSGSLLVSFLDRYADTPEGVLSDDPNVVKAVPRFMFYRSDLINVDYIVPNASALSKLLNAEKRSDPTVLAMDLSPKIDGLYTLAMQGQTSTAFYVLAFDPAEGVFSTASHCEVIDSGICLIPWEVQDCFLTTFPNEEYRKQMVNMKPEDYDRSKWVLQKAHWIEEGNGTYGLAFESIGPDSFDLARFALNSSGTFLFWQEGRTGNDEYLLKDDGTYEVSGEDDAVWQIKACRVRADEQGNFHFSDPFVAADVQHPMDTLEVVETHNRYAPFEVLSTEYIDTGEKTMDQYGDEKPFYHASYLWYTSIPNLQCATVTGAACILPAVSAGGPAKFDVEIRNDGNSFLSACTLQMYVHDVEMDDKDEPILDSEGKYIDRGVQAVGDPFTLEFSEETLLESQYNSKDDKGNFIDVEPDFALPPGKSSFYRVVVEIPEDWGGVKWVSFTASDPVMAEGGGMSAMSDGGDDTVWQTYTVKPGSYPVVEKRSSITEGKDRRFMSAINLGNDYAPTDTISDSPAGYYPDGLPGGEIPADAKVDASDKKGAAKGSDNGSYDDEIEKRGATSPKTADSVAPEVLAGVGLTGAALAAYSKRRLANERAAGKKMSKDDSE